MRLILKVILFFFIALNLMNCGGRRNIARMPTEERFAYAKELYEKGKYFDAKTQFQILILNNPGSSIVDEAQYYFADCYFHQNEFITAAAEFEKLISLYPRSDFVDDAQYKVCLSYYELSPKASLDQKYTFSAIDALQQLLEEHPQSDYIPDATQKLQDLRSKLAKKEYNAGDQYRRFGYFESAIISFDEVLRIYFDTKYAGDAYYWKAYCQFRIGNYDEAKLTLQTLLSKFPNTSYKQRIKELTTSIENSIKEKNETAANNNQKNDMQK